MPGPFLSYSRRTLVAGLLSFSRRVALSLCSPLPPPRLLALPGRRAPPALLAALALPQAQLSLLATLALLQARAPPPVLPRPGWPLSLFLGGPLGGDGPLRRGACPWDPSWDPDFDQIVVCDCPPRCLGCCVSAIVALLVFYQWWRLFEDLGPGKVLLERELHPASH